MRVELLADLCNAWRELLPVCRHGVSRSACDNACRPIFLTAAGLARPGATATLTGLRWLSPDGAWCPESNLFQCGPTFYSPELGQSISPPSAGKKEFKGHVTLLK